MRIPIVGAPGVPRSQPTFQPQDGTTFDKVARAGAALGGAVVQVGGLAAQIATDKNRQAGQLAAQIKTAVDTGTLARVQTEQEAHLQSFIDGLSDGQNPENNDPSSFVTRWQSEAATFDSSLTSDNSVKSLAPAARAELSASRARWQISAAQKIGHLATEKAVANAVGDIRNAYASKLAGNDVEGAVATVKRGVDTGVFNPEEGAKLVAGAPAAAEENQVYTLMNRSSDVGGGPIVAEKALNATNEDGSFKYYPNLTGHSRETLTHYAYQNANALRSQTAQTYAEQAAAGTPVDPNAVVRDLAAGKLTQSQANSLLKPVKVFSADAFAGISTAIAGADLLHDDDHKKEAQLRAMINEASPNLDTASTSRLNETLKDALDPKSSHNTPVAQEVFRNAAADRDAGLFLPRAITTEIGPSGVWFLPDKFFGAKTQTMANEADVGSGDVKHWRDTAPKAIRDAEERHYADFLGRMRSYFTNYSAAHNGAEPTDQEATEYAQGLKKPYAMEAASAVLTAPAAAIPTKAGARVTQGGVTYELDKDGKTWNPVK